MTKFNDSERLLIDIIRIIATHTVVIGHAFSFFGKQAMLSEKNLPYPQSLAVTWLFILSGFLIAYSLFEKHQKSYMDFLTRRMIRIYSVMIPGLIFVVAMDSIFLTNDFEYVKALNIETFLANCLMVFNFPVDYNIPLLRTTTLGTARQLWTMPLEVWNYILFATLIYGCKLKQRRYLLMMAISGVVPLYNVVSGRGNGLTVVWLLGVIMYFLRKHVQLYFSKIQYILIATASILVAGFRIVSVHRIQGTDYDPIYAICSMLFIMSSLGYARQYQIALHRSIKWGIHYIAKYCFSIYVTHYTVLYWFKSEYQTVTWDRLLYIILCVNIVAIVFHWMFEYLLYHFMLQQYHRFTVRRK